MEAELAAYFETWLTDQYRRGEDEGEGQHLVCFPAVHLPRGELAGVLRLPVRLRFLAADGRPFVVPTRRERAQAKLPGPPIAAELLAVERSEGTLPFFIDTRLLHRQLGVHHERIDALFETLRSRADVSETEVASALVRLLDEDDAADLRGGDPFVALAAACARRLARLGTRARAFPVAIVMNAQADKTTRYLQRELKALSEAPKALGQTGPLHSYLTHRPGRSSRETQYALHPSPPLTPVQREVAEHFWGSRLSAVQGPPGTGKTTLILHLCAEYLTRQVDALVAGERSKSGMLVIASSNNRAVDNVLSGLGNSELTRLPLSLRAGSRQVMEEVLLPALVATRRILAEAARMPEETRRAEMKEALYAFCAERHRCTDALAGRSAALARTDARSALEDERAGLEMPGPLSARATQLHALSETDRRQLTERLQALTQRLEAHALACENTESAAALLRVQNVLRKTAQKQWKALDEGLRAAGLDAPTLATEFPAEDDHDARQEALQNRLECALDALSALKTDLTLAHAAADYARKAHTLGQMLATLDGVPEAAVDMPADYAPRGLALFEAAVRAREAWAFAHAERLVDALDAAVEGLRDERTLRGFFRDEPEHAARLTQLFGIWGCTLLSLGNLLAPEPGSIEHLIIDEAGQCHPAHAISGLLRARRAMVLGDVHQLTPVIELGEDDEARMRHTLRLQLAPSTLAPFRVHNKAEASAQSVADLAVQERRALIDHFRCQPDIIALSNELCGYGLRVHTPRAARREVADLLPHALMHCDVKGTQEELGGSYHNAEELAILLQLLTSLRERGIPPTDIAVITPYRGQLEKLTRACLALGYPLERSAELAEQSERSLTTSGLSLGTVHRFQGGERDIVIFSSVVSELRSLPFINSRPNLLNVAISRARMHFVSLGDHAVLTRGEVSRVLTRGHALPISQ
jgi:RecA/RadA recombinase